MRGKLPGAEQPLIRIGLARGVAALAGADRFAEDRAPQHDQNMPGSEVAAVRSIVLTKIAATHVDMVRKISAVMA